MTIKFKELVILNFIDYSTYSLLNKFAEISIISGEFFEKKIKERCNYGLVDHESLYWAIKNEENKKSLISR